MTPKEVKREVDSLAKRYPKKGMDSTIPEDIRNTLVDRQRMKDLEEGEKYMKQQPYAKGGKIDGCAQRGKTRGKVV